MIENKQKEFHDRTTKRISTWTMVISEINKKKRWSFIMVIIEKNRLKQDTNLHTSRNFFNLCYNYVCIYLLSLRIRYISINQTNVKRRDVTTPTKMFPSATKWNLAEKQKTIRSTEQGEVSCHFYPAFLSFSSSRENPGTYLWDRESRRKSAERETLVAD